jgi:hypothetical protein
MSSKNSNKIPDEQTKRTRRKKRKTTFCQTSRLENPEGLQLHHNHEKILFLTVLLLFAQCEMNSGD